MTLTTGWQLVKKTFREFAQDNCSILAAALAYYALVSLVPLLMLGVSVAGFVLGSSGAAVDRVLEFVKTIMPTATEEAAKLTRSLVKSRGIVSGIGLLGLFWSGTHMFFVLEKAMNIAWDCPPRGWLRSRVLALGMVAAMGLFWLLSFGTTLTVSVIQGYKLTIFGVRPSRFVFPTLGFLLPLLVTVAMFTALYKFTPNCKVSWQSARAGGLLAGLLFEAAKVGFAFYVANFGHFDRVYGSIAGIISLVLWSFYGATVTLLGAEFASEYDKIISGQ